MKSRLFQDEYVDREFGTGVLKITPAHDINDYELGRKYNLETIDIFNDNGTLNEKAVLFKGEDRFTARIKIIQKLTDIGQVDKVEEYINKIGYSERTDVVIEPKLSIQWFLKMKEMARPALENVMNDSIRLYPPKFKNTYRHWMENVRDWCISRQLWWGHRIPAFYIKDTNQYVVASSAEEALKLARIKTSDDKLTLSDLRQDEDVLDTWCSSWLWPISVFDGIRNPDNADIKYYYPTDDLVTAPEILFFWVARMIMAGYEFKNDKPFKNVYLTGIVRDKLGRKMSKSLGNSPDPLDLIDKYGADGVRVGMLLCSPAGNDLLFDESLTEQGRNFGNKIWNAFRLVKSWQTDESISQPDTAVIAIEWFGNILNKTIAELDDQFEKYRISEALMLIYKIFRDEFCSWYLEIVKPAYKHPIDSITYKVTVNFFDKLLKLLHPFMPFITEEIWHYLTGAEDNESIMITNLPIANSFDDVLIDRFELAKEIITIIRNIRQEKNMATRESLTMQFINDENRTLDFSPVIKKLSNLSSIELVKEKPAGAVSFLVKSTEYYIPLEGKIDVEEEMKKIKDELQYSREFLESVLKKLSNVNFVNNAPPQVLQNEYNKKADAEARISALEERLKNLR